ncbi:MAG: hypothetical protein QM751_07740 [Paludibacteraceae bacterium]
MIIVFLFLPQINFAATRIASVPGNWNARATWGGATVPTSADDVIVNSNISVIVNTNAVCKTLTINDNGLLSFITTGGYNLTVSGATNIKGTLILNIYNGTKIFVGLVTIYPTGVWNNSGGSPATFRGGVTNNGTFNAGSPYSYTFDTNAQALTGNIDMAGAGITVNGVTLTNNGVLTTTGNFSGSGTFVNSTAGTYNNNSDFTITNLINNGIINKNDKNLTPTNITNTGILNITGSVYTYSNTLVNSGVFNLTSSNGINTPYNRFTNTGVVNLNGTAWLSGITNNLGGVVNLINVSQSMGTFVNATNTSVLNILALTTSESFINALTATTSGNTVNYCGVGNQVIKCWATSYSNLKLTGSGIKTFTAAVAMSDTMTVVDGVKGNLGFGFIHTAGYLFFNDEQQAAGSWGGETSPAQHISTVYFTKNTGIINVSKGPNYWLGATSNDWGTASNWTSNTVPQSGKDVEFATVNNFGEDAKNNLVLDQDRVVGKLTNNSIKQLIIPAGKSLTVTDILATNGDPGAVQIKADITLPNGALIFTNPQLNQSVKATVEMYSKGFERGYYNLG